MNFYTSVKNVKGKIAFRGVENGRRVSRLIDYSPSLYVRAQDKNSPHSSIHDEPLQKTTFGSIREAKDFLESYKGVDGFDIYGNPKWEYAWITETYGAGIIGWDINLLRIINFDIEVDSSTGFPDINKAESPVTLITIQIKDKFIVMGYGGDFIPPTDKNIEYIDCKNENDLLKKFLDFWTNDYPDIITGWNVSGFDIPYLLHRIARLFGEPEAKRLSPWKNISKREIELLGKTHVFYELSGISTYDYLEIFKKYAKNNSQESYKLDHIGHVVLGLRKLNYDEYSNLHTLREQNYQKFCEYGIRDVELVGKLEEKLHLIEQCMYMALNAKVNPMDVMAQVRMWTQIIDNHLYSENKFVRIKLDSEFEDKDEKYEGAYVKDPNPGLYHWLASFDATSLYPMIMISCNISPDTLIEPRDYTNKMRDILSNDYSVKSLLNKNLDLFNLQEMGLCFTPNGQFFTHKKQGFLPKILEKMYEDRAKYKKMMLAIEDEMEKCTDPVKKKELKFKKDQYDNLQSALKIGLNSCYGFLGNQYSIYYDVRMAEAVTKTGQFAIQWAEQKVNAYMSNLLKTNNNYVIAADTDSVYIVLDELLKKFLKEFDTKRGVDFTLGFCDKQLGPAFTKWFDELSDYMNLYKRRLHMKHELICDRGFWTGKKYYALNVWYSEGIRYDKSKTKVKGLAVIKSTTPAIIREHLKNVVELVLNKTNVEVLDKNEQVRTLFMKLNPEDIAQSKSAGALEDYKMNPDGSMQKGTPFHIKGALLYNHLLRKTGLDKKYPLIQIGEKIKVVYLKEPNPIGSKVIAFADILPTELNLTKYLDYDTQFQLVYLQPVQDILNAIGWQIEETNTLF